MLHIQRASIQWIRLANEGIFRDSRAATYGLNLPADLLSSDRGSGQGCGTGRDTGPGYGTNI